MASAIDDDEDDNHQMRAADAFAVGRRDLEDDGVRDYA